MFPGFAAVETAIDAALGRRRFYDRIDQSAVARKKVEADAPLIAARESVGQLLPGAASVGRAEDAAARAAAVESPSPPLPLVHGREHHVWISRVHRQIGRAGVFILEENFLPGQSAVRGF